MKVYHDWESVATVRAGKRAVFLLPSADPKGDAHRLLILGAQKLWGFAALPEIRREPGGKPVFAAAPGKHFSLSHTRGWAMCVLWDSPVGCDVEVLRTPSPRLFQAVMGREPQPGGEGAFCQAWVRLEAGGKRTGGGVLSRLRGQRELPGERFLEFELDGARAAVCWSEKGGD